MGGILPYIQWSDCFRPAEFARKPIFARIGGLIFGHAIVAATGLRQGINLETA